MTIHHEPQPGSNDPRNVAPLTPEQLREKYKAESATVPKGQRHKDYFPRKKEKHSRIKRLLAGVATLAAVTAGGVAGYNGLNSGDGEPNPQNPTATAGETPGVAEYTPSKEECMENPAICVGFIRTDYDTLNVSGSDEAIEEALSKKIPDTTPPEKAVEAIGKQFNAFYHSTKSDISGNATPESLTKSDQILENFVDDGVDTTGFKQIRKELTQADLALSNYNAFDGHLEEQLNIVSGEKEFATSHYGLTLDPSQEPKEDVNSNGEKTLTVLVDVNYVTNLGELQGAHDIYNDPETGEYSPEGTLLANYENQRELVLVSEEGNWVVSSLE